MKQVMYFFEGETEKQLLNFLKSSKKIKSGKLKKHNLWLNKFKTIRSIPKKNTQLFFIIDTDDIENTGIFIKNLQTLKFHEVCLIIQNKNLEDELSYACNKKNTQVLFKDFYTVTSKDKFKNKFANDKNLAKILTNNQFDFDKLWTRSTIFSKFLEKNNLNQNLILCTTKP